MKRGIGANLSSDRHPTSWQLDAKAETIPPCQALQQSANGHQTLFYLHSFRGMLTDRGFNDSERDVTIMTASTLGLTDDPSDSLWTGTKDSKDLRSIGTLMLRSIIDYYTTWEYH